MAWVTQDLIDVWESGEYVGENTPMAVVQVQLGHWVRGWYRDDVVPFPPVRAKILGEGGYGPHDPQLGHWSAQWVTVTDWIDVPNLFSIKRTKDFQQKGITVVEVVLDAQDFVPKVGALGDAYHVIEPGYLAPTRGYVAPDRPDPHWEASPWSPVGEQGRITDGVKIRVWQGYGQPQTAGGNTPPTDGGDNGAWTFVGQIDDVDLDGNPNQLTITARNGKLLTDQRVFRASKSVQLKDPITFWDELDATQRSLHGSGANASSTQSGFPARNVLDPPKSAWNVNDGAYKTEWISQGTIDDTNLEWIEIRLPAGRYDNFWMGAPDGLLAYVGIYAKSIQHSRKDPTGDGLLVETDDPTMDGAPLTPDAWVDLGSVTPGAHGGWPYVMEFKTGTTLPDRYPGLNRPSLGHEFELGDRSILRVGLTKPSGSGVAHVTDLHGLRQAIKKQVEKEQFILVDDASEVAKVVFRWAGFQQWEVEDANVRLSDGTNYGPGVVTKSGGKLVFNRKDYLVDIVTKLGEQLGYIFFIADPIDGDSEGVPTFRRDSSLLIDNSYIAADLNEDTMLTGLKAKHTDSDRPYIIRFRGKTAKPRDGGVPLGGDSIDRLMATYLPPWSRPNDVRIAGVLRHITFQDDQLVTYAMCLYGCFLTALNAALQMHTAIVEIPAHPILELDDQVTVLDEATGTNTRLWIVKFEDTMQLGQQASWKQTLEGSLIDSDDFQAVLAQVTGQAPFVVGVPGGPVFEETINSIDWSHVTNPETGHVSGYTSPAKTGVSRTPRTR